MTLHLWHYLLVCLFDLYSQKIVAKLVVHNGVVWLNQHNSLKNIKKRKKSFFFTLPEKKTNKQTFLRENIFHTLLEEKTSRKIKIKEKNKKQKLFSLKEKFIYILLKDEKNYYWRKSALCNYYLKYKSYIPVQKMKIFFFDC